MKQSRFDTVALDKGGDERRPDEFMKRQSRIIPNLIGTISLLMASVNWAAVGTPQKPQPIGKLLSSDPASIVGHSEWTGSTDPEEMSLLIFSGNKISIQKGIALLELNQSQGTVGMCGRTSVSVLSSNGTQLYALQTGALSLDVTSPTTDRIMTPEYVVEWNPAAGTNKKMGVVNLNPNGHLCVQNIAGLVRIRDQFSESVLELNAGLSAQLEAHGLNDARMLKHMDCGCSAPRTASRPQDAAALIFKSGSGLMVEGKNSATVSRAVSAPPTAPVSIATTTPAAIKTTNQSQVVSSVRSTPAPSPVKSPETLQAPAPAPTVKQPADPVAMQHPMAMATLAVSAEDLKRSPPKKSLGQKVRGFFRRLFSRKRLTPVSTPASNS